jgi:hypothetical protein
MLMAPRARRKCGLRRFPGARVQTPMEEARRPQLSRQTLHRHFAVRIGLEREDIMRRCLILRSEAAHGRVRIAERQDEPIWPAVTRLLGAVIDPPPIALAIEEVGQRSSIDDRWRPDRFRMRTSFGHVGAIRVGSCGQLVFTPTRPVVPFDSGRVQCNRNYNATATAPASKLISRITASPSLQLRLMTRPRFSNNAKPGSFPLTALEMKQQANIMTFCEGILFVGAPAETISPRAIQKKL